MNDFKVTKTKVYIGDVEVELDYTNRSFDYLEDEKIPFMDIFGKKDMKEVFSKSNRLNISKAVYAGLIRYGEDGGDVTEWTVDKVHNLIRINQMAIISKAIIEAITLSLPDAKKEDDKEKDPTKAPETAQDGIGTT